MNTSILTLSGSTITLRTVREQDAAAMVDYRRRDEVARFQFWENFDLEAAEALIADQQGLVVNTPESWYQLVMVHNESGAVIGDLVLHFIEEEQAEVGFNLSPDYQRRGYATEALKLALDYLFNRLGKYRVIATLDTDNVASARLVERVGMRREAHFIENVWYKGHYGSEYQYALLAREWAGRLR